MISSSQFLCLFLLACPIYCIIRSDRVTLSSQTLEELSQSQLSTSNSGYWGRQASDIFKCVNPSDKYFNTISYQSSISKQFTELPLHNYVYVTFDIIYINFCIEGQVEIDGTSQFFNIGKIDSYNYECTSPTGNVYIDSYGQITSSVGFLLSHSNSSMKITIKPTSIGQQGRLGVSNMKIYITRCGSNASFDTTTKKCSCDSGYKQTDILVPSTLSTYQIQTQCVKK